MNKKLKGLLLLSPFLGCCLFGIGCLFYYEPLASLIAFGGGTVLMMAVTGLEILDNS